MRREFEHRPVLIALSGLVVGLSCAFCAWHALFALPLVVLCCSWGRRCVLVGAFLVGVLLRPVPGVPVVERGFYEGPAHVLSVPAEGSGLEFARVSIRGGRYELAMPKGSAVSLGDEIQLKAVLEPLKEGRAGSTGTVGVLRCVADVELIRAGPGFWRAGVAVRKSFIASMDSVAGEAAPVVDGVCFSVNGDMDGALWDNLKRTGTIHIVCASGLHVWLLFLGLAYLVKLIPMPRWAQLGLLTLALGLYVGAAGCHAASLRAAAMAMVVSWAYLLRREADGLSALSLIGLAYLIWRPYDIADVGFQLSMLTVGGLILYVRGRRPRGVLWDVVGGSLVASLWSAPVLAYTFGEVPLVSPVANLLVTPVAMLLMVGGLGAWVLGLACPAIGALVSAVLLRPLSSYVTSVVAFMAGLPLATVFVPRFSAYWLLLVYGLLVLAWRPHVASA